MRLVSCARTSGTGDGEDSFEVQETRVSGFAARGGHEVVLRVRDEHVQGSVPLDERVGLLAALLAVQDGEANGVCVSVIDRFARELHVQEAALAAFWNLGPHVKVFEVDRGEILRDDPEDPYRTFLRQVMGAAAQLERGMIRRRTTHGRRRKAAAGGYTGGPRLHRRFGYRILDGDYTRVADEQKTIAAMAALRATPMSFRAVTAGLAAAGHEAPTGGPWHPTTVRGILKREGLA